MQAVRNKFAKNEGHSHSKHHKNSQLTTFTVGMQSIRGGIVENVENALTPRYRQRNIISLAAIIFKSKIYILLVWRQSAAETKSNINITGSSTSSQRGASEWLDIKLWKQRRGHLKIGCESKSCNRAPNHRESTYYHLPSVINIIFLSLATYERSVSNNQPKWTVKIEQWPMSCI